MPFGNPDSFLDPATHPGRSGTHRNGMRSAMSHAPSILDLIRDAKQGLPSAQKVRSTWPIDA